MNFTSALLLAISLIACGSQPHKPTIVTVTVPCIETKHPKFPGLPGAHACGDNMVCIPTIPDSVDLAVWIDEITAWAKTQEALCGKPETTEE